MRKVSFLSYNMSQSDGADQDGRIPVGRQFDFIGDVETEDMILVDGDESLCLGYHDVACYEDVYVGDMMDFKATLTNIGNTSRDCRIEAYKLATPAFRAGKKDAVPGEMVWFDKPVLCTEGNVRLIVKKHLQRGEQPDGTVIDPWRLLEDFPQQEADAQSGDSIIFRYRMSDRDKFYGGGVVNGARSITLAENAAARLMAKVFKNTGRCIGVNKVRLYTPCFAGDYMEFHARLLRMEEDVAIIQVRSFKIIVVPENPPYPSSIDVLQEPILSTVVEFRYKVRRVDENTSK